MDTTVVYFLYLVCSFCYGYCSPNAITTLVLTEKRCDENNYNNTDTSVQYENVTYDDVRELEDQIMKLLSNGDEVRLSDYGIIKLMDDEHYITCKTFKDTDEYKDIIFKFRMSIREAMKQPEESLKKSLKNSYIIGYVEEACTFVPISPEVYSAIHNSPIEYDCTLNDSRDSFDVMSDDIYMTVMPAIKHTFDVTDDKRIRFLCTYIVNGFSTNLVYRTSYCGLPTDGTICATTEHIEDNEICEGIGQVSYRFLDMPLERTDMYVMKKQLGCRYQECPVDRTPLIQIMQDDTAKGHLQHLMNERGHTIYFDDQTYFHVLEIDNRPNNDNMCVSIIQDTDKIFVKTQNCEIPMRHICKKVSYTRESNKEMGNHKWIIVGVTVCITLVAVLIAVIVRRYFRWNNRASSINAHHRDESISEMYDGGPPTRRSGTVVLTRPRTEGGSAGSVPGGPGTIGDTSCPTDGGSVPGRSGTVDVSQPTEGGQVYGRLAGGGTNMYYSDGPNN